jgi:hypothetical protein
MDPSSDTRMHFPEPPSDLLPSETPPKSRRIVSFYPTSAGSTALWPDDLPIGTDALTYPQGHSNQQLGSVTGLHAWIIEARSPLIAAAFESSISGKRLHLDSLDSGTVLPFVRFLYTGYYAQIGDWEDVPTSVWLHCRMYYLGHLYDLADLKSQAYVNVLRQCEFGCSSPCMPIDLCPAIDFVYRHLSGHDAISDALVQYCVTRCLNHRLHENAEFKNVAFFVRAFHQDLTRACRDRDYEDESAAIIIQLPYMHYAPATYASTEDPPISKFEDIIHHYHSNDRFDNISPKKRQRVTFDERQTSPTKALKLQESTEQPVNGLALRQASEKPTVVTNEDQSTQEREVKLPDVDAAPEMQQSSLQKPHRQQPQMVITSRAISKQAAPTQRPPARGVPSRAQRTVAKTKTKEEASLRKPSAVETFSKAQEITGNLTEQNKMRLRQDTLRNMYEEQLQQTLARKQDPLFQHIYEKTEQEAMNECMLAQATGDQQQEVDLPLRPASETSSRATSYITKKLPGHPSLPSSTNLPEDNVSHKDESLPIWKRRDMTGTNSGLSQALETLRNQEKQSRGDESIESAAPQKQSGPAMYQPKKNWRQRRVIDAEFNPTFHGPQSVQGKEVAQDSRHPSMQRDPSAKSTREDPFIACFEDATPPTSVTPSTRLRVTQGNHALQDYQMQLMLLEQQNKKRLLMARQEQDSMPYPYSPAVNASTNMQPAVPSAFSKLQDETSREGRPERACAPPGVRNRRGSISTAAGNAVDAAAGPDNVARASASEESTVLHPSETQHGSLSDLSFQLMLLESQNKKRLLMRRLDEEESLERAPASNQPPVPELDDIQKRIAPAEDPSLRAHQSSANVPARKVPVRTYVEARTLEEYQSQLQCLEELNRENLGGSREATRATSPPVAAAPASDHTQGGFAFNRQNGSEGDALADFDFDAFLGTNVMESEGSFDFDAFLAEDPAEQEESGRHSGLFESDSEHGTAASDSDAQSWVDVAMEPAVSGGGKSPSDAAVTGRSTSVSVPSPTRRSPYHSDSEWEFC